MQCMVVLYICILTYLNIHTLALWHFVLNFPLILYLKHNITKFQNPILPNLTRFGFDRNGSLIIKCTAPKLMNSFLEKKLSYFHNFFPISRITRLLFYTRYCKQSYIGPITLSGLEGIYDLRSFERLKSN